MQSVGPGQPPIQLLELVGRRYEFLAILNTETYGKRSLEERLDVSRSTIDRALRELETASLVRRTSNGYRTTLYGCTLVAIYASMLDYVNQAQRAKSLLAKLSPEIEFSIGLVIDAEIVLAEEPAFHAPTTRTVELVEAASEIRGLAYAYTSPEAMELLQQQILDAGTAVEIVFRRRMYRNFEAADPKVVESLAAADNYTAYVTSGIPFGLFLLTIDGTERVCLIVYDDERNLEGIIVNDTAEAAAWGNRLFERYRGRAEPVVPGNGSASTKRR